MLFEGAVNFHRLYSICLKIFCLYKFKNSRITIRIKKSHNIKLNRFFNKFYRKNANNGEYFHIMKYMHHHYHSCSIILAGELPIFYTMISNQQNTYDFESKLVSVYVWNLSTLDSIKCAINLIPIDEIIPSICICPMGFPNVFTRCGNYRLNNHGHRMVSVVLYTQY